MSEDLIKRSDAIKAVSKVDDYGDGIGFEVRSHCLVELELVPSAEVKTNYAELLAQIHEQYVAMEKLFRKSSAEIVSAIREQTDCQWK